MECVLKIVLTIISLVVIGLALALLVASSVAVKATAIGESSDWLFPMLCFFSVLTGIALFFCVYAACCGNFCANISLSIIFILFDVFILILAISILSIKGSYMATYRDLWKNAVTSRTDREKKDEIEVRYRCCGFDSNISYGRNCTHASEPCEQFLSAELDTFIFSVGGMLIILFVALTIGIVLSFWETLKRREKEHEEESPQLNERWFVPVAYGF